MMTTSYMETLEFGQELTTFSVAKGIRRSIICPTLNKRWWWKNNITIWSESIILTRYTRQREESGHRGVPERRTILLLIEMRIGNNREDHFSNDDKSKIRSRRRRSEDSHGTYQIMTRPRNGWLVKQTGSDVLVWTRHAPTELFEKYARRHTLRNTHVFNTNYKWQNSKRNVWMCQLIRNPVIMYHRQDTEWETDSSYDVWMKTRHIMTDVIVTYHSFFWNIDFYSILKFEKNTKNEEKTIQKIQYENSKKSKYTRTVLFNSNMKTKKKTIVNIVRIMSLHIWITWYVYFNDISYFRVRWST